MRAALQLAEEAERCEVSMVHATHFEDVFGADVDAVLLAFALVAIDEGTPGAGLGAALLTWAVGMTGGAACLLGVANGLGHGSMVGALTTTAGLLPTGLM